MRKSFLAVGLVAVLLLTSVSQAQFLGQLSTAQSPGPGNSVVGGYFGIYEDAFAFFLLPQRHQIAFGGEVVDARPRLQKVARLPRGKRRKTHKVERAIRHDEYAPRVPQIRTDGIPYRAPESFARLAINGLRPLGRPSGGP